MAVSSVRTQPASFVDWYHRNRQRSRTLFDLLADEAYYSQPIELRHPIVFYDGHLPAFAFNTLVKRALGRPGIDERLEALFARGIDPSTRSEPDASLRTGASSVQRVSAGSPDRRAVRAVRARAAR